MKKIITKLQLSIVLFVASIRMQVAIRKVKSIYRTEAKKRNNRRDNIQYLVLLSLPVARKNKVVLKERLHWVNRKNFRKLKNKGFIRRDLNLFDMKVNAFYWTNIDRSYAKDYQAQKAAIRKYQDYIKERLSRNKQNS